MLIWDCWDLPSPWKGNVPGQRSHHLRSKHHPQLESKGLFKNADPPFNSLGKSVQLSPIILYDIILSSCLLLSKILINRYYFTISLYLLILYYETHLRIHEPQDVVFITI